MMKILERRLYDGTLRSLKLEASAPSPAMVDFSSNDYLGLARDPALHQTFLDRVLSSH